MLFFTSDLHISHRNIIKYCPDTRGHFKSPEEMNDTMIYNWNSKISKDDDVIIIGDLSFTNTRETGIILKKMNGKKTLIFGNHDNRIREKTYFLDEYFVHYSDMMDAVIDDVRFIFCHYPHRELIMKDYTFNDLQFDIFLHGHKHSTSCILDDKNRMVMDIGMDSNNLIPHSIEEIMTKYQELLKDKTQ
ncbi:MAG: metallophosphoesterase family protein [Flavobacterium sp.]|uniref:metallophosphoesterase n=1 Tax=Flavobacterium sp. TaxID=239 RepID=UPI00260EC6F8|nr:metallophosphoesterase [Flavobacterium sp.]MDD5151276.1 metallophosphoesterase family protein [Flavobacterium sp.]